MKHQATFTLPSDVCKLKECTNSNTDEEKDDYLCMKCLGCDILTHCKMFVVSYVNYRICFYHNFIVTLSPQDCKHANCKRFAM